MLQCENNSGMPPLVARDYMPEVQEYVVSGKYHMQHIPDNHAAALADEHCLIKEMRYKLQVAIALYNIRCLEQSLLGPCQRQHNDSYTAFIVLKSALFAAFFNTVLVDTHEALSQLTMPECSVHRGDPVLVVAEAIMRTEPDPYARDQLVQLSRETRMCTAILEAHA